MFLKGKLVNYRSLEIGDSELFFKWCSNRDAVRYSLSWFQTPKSNQDFKDWLTSINSSSKNINLGICCEDTGQLIGYAGIANISSLNQSGEYFIFIGDSEFWGKGIGTEVTKTITNYGFNTLSLHRIFLSVSELNLAGMKAYENAGYIKEGLLRDAAFRDGKFHNKFLMSVLSSEWKIV